MRNNIRIIALFLILLSPIIGQGQDIDMIIDILDNPGKYIGSEANVEGTVTQWVVSPGGTNYYILKGDYGGKIKVNSLFKPETEKRYKVQGLVQKDAIQSKPIIVEINRVLIDGYGGVDTSTVDYEDGRDGVDWGLISLLIAIIIIIAIIVYLITKKSSGKLDASFAAQPSEDAGIYTEDDFKTIKMPATGPPKTMKFIPGVLEIISLEDKGKSFRFAGYPTAEGSVVSIGRGSVTGDKQFAHIEIDQRFRTVSRKQAEIREKGGELFVKNLTDSNPTQVNGEELQTGEERPLKSGDIVRMGELEFKYVL